jgi:uncharacterized protein (TIGR04255 family)
MNVRDKAFPTFNPQIQIAMNSRLPKAPLTEVVFEMRWDTLPAPPLPVDPGYPVLLDAFSNYARKRGFDSIEDKMPQYAGVGRSISRRFRIGQDAFPLLQLGHGLYAANESVNYEWASFKQMAADGASCIIDAYPKLEKFDLTISHVELRYIDTFEETLVGTTDIAEFINRATEEKVVLSPFWAGKLLSGEHRGRIHFESDVKKLPGSVFFVDFASAKRDEAPVIRMETKVVWSGSGLFPVRSASYFSKKLEPWLEHAHEVTHNSFFEIIKPTVLDRFK